MKRRINHTGRHRLTSDMFTVSLQDREGLLSYTLDRLDYSAFPDIAGGRLVVEAYRGALYERNDLGVLSQVTFGVSRPLNHFTNTNLPLFRLKVVDEEARLLAEADNIQPFAPGEDPCQVRSLLAAERFSNMGDLPWRVSEEMPPTLQINSALGNPEAFLRRPGVLALILPEALRQILTMAEQQREEAEEVEWISNWLRMGEKLAGYREVAETSAEWVNRAVERFAREQRLLNQLAGWAEEEEA